MNKLVSKNPILRFKLGRKIVKARNGLLFIYYKGRDGKDYEAWRAGDDWYYRQKGTTGMTRMPYDYVTTTGKRFYKSTSRGAVANTYDIVNNMSRPARTNVFPEEVDKNYTHNFLEALRAGYRPNRDGTWKEPTTSSSTPTDTSTDTSTTYVRKSPIYWNQLYTNFLNNLTTNLKDWLTNQGVKYDDVKALQEFLNNKGFGNRGTQGLDGKWGTRSLAAWDKFIAQTDFTPKVNINPELVEKDRRAIINLVLFTVPKGGISNFTPLSTTKTYNRADVRDFIRSKGRGAYDFSGNQRRALRMVLNGQGTDEDRAIVQGMNLFKQGGQLPSRNIVERFKQKNFRKVAQ